MPTQQIKLNVTSNRYFGLVIILIYGVLTAICFQNAYFWDVIQQVSKEAHWYYQTNFSSLLLPSFSSGSEIIATGYHPPLMGLMTALLWKVFGYHLWVSHLFIAFWAAILICQVWKLVTFLFPEKHIGWAALIILTEATVLAQFAIASPDFILLTAFVMSIRGVLEKKPLLTLIGFFFLCCINMRGVFAGIIILFSHLLFYFKQKKESKSFIKIFRAYIPTILLLIAYFTYYLSAKGWFFADSAYTEHYQLPEGGVTDILKRIFSFILRSVENGRFFVYLLAVTVTVRIFKSKMKPDPSVLFLLLVAFLLTGMYIVFIFITQMPFSSRYFMPQYLILTLLTLLYLSKWLEEKKMRLIFILILFFQFTGHFWLYPEKISKSWDGTLAHLPYYELRKECFDDIDRNELNYDEISAGFCLSPNRRFVELIDEDKRLGGDKTNMKYYIYSNISNLPDETIDEMKDTNRWKPVRQYKKGPVFITLYERLQVP